MVLLHLHHLPSSVKLSRRSKEVASICPHFCVSLSDDADTIGASEATDECDSFITCSNVLAVVIVHMETDKGFDALLFHQSSHPVKLGVSCCFDHNLLAKKLVNLFIYAKPVADNMLFYSIYTHSN